jgi:hypothetical protein
MTPQHWENDSVVEMAYYLRFRIGYELRGLSRDVLLNG